MVRAPQYQATDPSSVEGVIFKIHARTPVPIAWCSFVPEECEHLFMPNTYVEVKNWYTCTDVNLCSDMESAVGPFSLTNEVTGMDPDAFRLQNVSRLAQPVPLPQLGSKEELTQLFVHNKVLVIEMEEVIFSVASV